MMMTFKLISRHSIHILIHFFLSKNYSNFSQKHLTRYIAPIHASGELLFNFSLLNDAALLPQLNC